MTVPLAHSPAAPPGAWCPGGFCLPPTSRPGLPSEGAGAATLCGRIFVEGGSANTAANDIYSPYYNSWTSGVPIPHPRVEPAGIVAIGDCDSTANNVYVISGIWRDSSHNELTKTVEAYNPFGNGGAGAWTQLADIPFAGDRAGVTVIYLGIGTARRPFIFVIGGYDFFNQAAGVFKKVQAYDVVNNLWYDTVPPNIGSSFTGQLLRSMPTAREGELAATVGGKIYAIGGLSDPRCNPTCNALNIVEAYDPIQNLWCSSTFASCGSGWNGPIPASMPTPRGVINNMGGVLCGDTIFVVGGQAQGTTGNPYTVQTNEGYYPAANTWTTYALMPTSRAEASSAVYGNSLYVFQGFQNSIGNDSPANVAEYYVPTCSRFPWGISPAGGSTIALATPCNTTGTTAVTVTSSSFSGTISLTASTSHQGLNATVSPASVTLFPGESVNVTLSVSAQSVSAGDYEVTVTGSNGTATLSTIFTVLVSPLDFSITSVPGYLNLTPGATQTSNVELQSFCFSGHVSLSGTISPAPSANAPTLSFSPAKLSLSAGGSASSQLTFSTVPATPLQIYSINITGTSGTVSHSFYLTAQTFDFNFSANPSNLIVAQGSSSNVTVQMSSPDGDGMAVSLSASLSPNSTDGPRLAFALAVVPLSSDDSVVPAMVSTTLTMSALPETTPGTYTLVITGVSGSVIHSTTVFVAITFGRSASGGGGPPGKPV